VEQHSKCAQLVGGFWFSPAGDALRKLRTRATIGDPPAPAVIPISEFKAFADEIATLIFPSPRAARRRRDAARLIAEHLDRTNDRRAALWEQAVNRDVSWIISKIEQGRSSWHYPHAGEPCGDNHIPTRHAAQEGVRFAVDFSCG